MRSPLTWRNPEPRPRDAANFAGGRPSCKSPAGRDRRVGDAVEARIIAEPARYNACGLELLLCLSLRISTTPRGRKGVPAARNFRVRPARQVFVRSWPQPRIGMNIASPILPEDGGQRNG
jgi:hypothetical protein